MKLKNNMRTQFALKVMKRFMTEKELNKFDKRYTENLHFNAGRKYIPTQEHLMIIDKWLKNGITDKNAAALMGCTETTFLGRVAKVMKRSS